jgi:ribosome-associated heat shock protein Hsp15
MEHGVSQRLDKWLFFSRLAKSRALAATLIEAGHVRVNSQRAMVAHKAVRAGDVITLALAQRTIVVAVRAIGTRRGPAPEAQALYEEVDP